MLYFCIVIPRYSRYINAIAPGAIHTPGLETILDIYARAAGITAEVLEAGDAKASTPIGFMGRLMISLR